METILVPTDFSENANDATAYAVELAAAMEAELVFFHAFMVSAPIYEAMTVNMATVELKRQNESALTEIADKYIAGRAIKYQVRATVGLAVNEIAAATDEFKAGLVIMGIRGASKFSQMVIGSTATAVVRNTDCPVLIIPQQVAFKKPERIVFASDNRQVTDYSVFSPLVKLVRHFQSRLFVLNIIKSVEHLSMNEAEDAFDPKNCFRDINYSIHIATADNVEEGIGRFAEVNEIDMVAILSRKHSFFRKIFLEDHTKHIAFKSKMPLLAISE